MRDHYTEAFIRDHPDSWAAILRVRHSIVWLRSIDRADETVWRRLVRACLHLKRTGDWRPHES